ncbi:hypothetical protein OF83DRAFT_596374 [Amylostereum chailletii]|nr:hypothetical protein OF83DRAFT_596374 [Amylostereum chailletii]
MLPLPLAHRQARIRALHNANGVWRYGPRCRLDTMFTELLPTIGDLISGIGRADGNPLIEDLIKQCRDIQVSILRVKQVEANPDRQEQEDLMEKLKQLESYAGILRALEDPVLYVHENELPSTRRTYAEAAAQVEKSIMKRIVSSVNGSGIIKHASIIPGGFYEIGRRFGSAVPDTLSHGTATRSCQLRLTVRPNTRRSFGKSGANSHVKLEGLHL